VYRIIAYHSESLQRDVLCPRWHISERDSRICSLEEPLFFEDHNLGRITRSTRDEGETLASCPVAILDYGEQELIRKHVEHLTTSDEKCE